MDFDKNDPRLTAYVLDELDAEESASIEAEAGSNPSLTEAIDELLRASRVVETSLATTDDVALHTAQRTQIESKTWALKPIRRRYLYAGATAAAAAAVLVTALLVNGTPSRKLQLTAAREEIEWKSTIEPTGAPVPASSSRNASTEQARQYGQQQRNVQSQKLPEPGSGEISLEKLDEFEVNFSTGSASSREVLRASGYADPQVAAVQTAPERVVVGQRVGLDRDADGIAEVELYTLAPGLGDGSTDYLGVRLDPRPAIVPSDQSRYLSSELGRPVQEWWDRGTLMAPGSGNSYASVPENPFVQVAQEPLSTFGLDVDTASYANVRRFLNSGHLPPPDAVRIEEFVNTFKYEYAAPTEGNAVAVTADIASCPWNPRHRLARVAVKAKDIPFEAQPPVRLTFLIDVSGSMEDAKKLPLLKESMKALVEKLRASDQIAIVTYRDTAQIAMHPMPAAQSEIIKAIIDGLHADGSTNGAGGIELAYNLATEQFLENGLNRVILATDGDFNVGETENTALVQRIEEHAKSGVFLTVLGFGVDNLQDDRLEGLANKGNGNYFYLDSFAEANRVLVERMAGTIAVTAKDAKIQVEFNPSKVGAYRLLGYENRALAAPDFNNDAKDAGDLGAGHTVTALYELVPVGVSLSGPGVDALKYQPTSPVPTAPANTNPETMTVKLRYKEPTASESKLAELPVSDTGAQIESVSSDFRMATAAAAFAMLLRNPEFKGNADFDLVQRLAESAKGSDADRAEFVSLVVAAKTLRK
ncbi:MAG: von Willebrand factor type A domain-containing protein [Candidatus Hydrogenedentes bacterium]|nr:von Willebrand factor type A domain-containing protein [Candidatus Hydrogenedentota bacterium]